MTRPVLEEAVFAAAAARDLRAATLLVQEQLRSGRPVRSVLASLVAVQVQVGERWYSDAWTVADEHAATAIVDAALAVVEGFVGAAEPEQHARSMVVACPEGEWHALPARILATELRSLGTEVIFLGSSMPADHLARYVDALRPEVVALSTSTPLSLGATAVSIDAVRGVGVPVVVGGRALGTSAHRARALGADGWSRDAAGILAGATWGPEAEDAAARRQERQLTHLRLELDRPMLVDGAMEELQRRIPVMARFDRRQLAHTRQDLEYIARFAEAAVLVDDLSVFHDFIGWLGPLLSSRGVPHGSVGASLDALASATSHDVLRSVLRSTTGPPAQS